MKKILYIDMDGVLADFGKAIKNHKLASHPPYDKDPDLIPNVFMELEPIPGALEAIDILYNSNKYDMYILTTAPWDNPDSWTHKRLWIEDKFGNKFKKKVIISHHKNLLKGDFLIDDRVVRGASDFEGEHIHFGWDYENNKWNQFPNWKSVLSYLL